MEWHVGRWQLCKTSPNAYNYYCDSTEENTLIHELRRVKKIQIVLQFTLLEINSPKNEAWLRFVRTTIRCMWFARRCDRNVSRVEKFKTSPHSHFLSSRSWCVVKSPAHQSVKDSRRKFMWIPELDHWTEKSKNTSIPMPVKLFGFFFYFANEALWKLN